jgi:hypothetical protein
MRRELLPGEIRNDRLTNWVLDFDGLNEVPHSQQDRRQEREPYVWMLESLVVTTLQRQVPFYFAALFSIGRQWSVSEKSLSALEKASTRENLLSSGRYTVESLLHRGSGRRGALSQFPAEYIAEGLAPILEAARDHHRNRMSDARRWWRTWQEEVGTLRKQVDNVQAVGRELDDERAWPQVAAITAQGYRPSMLRLSLEASGIRFKDDLRGAHSSSGINEVLAPLMVAALASYGGGGKHWPFRHFGEVFRHYLYDAMREMHYAPLRQAALRNLDKKYRPGGDPFSRFRPLKEPASEQLRDLVLEHALPGGLKSPSLEAWLSCLSPEPHSHTKLPGKDVENLETIRAFASSADSTIKRNIADDMIVGDSWPQFVQRLFESWVHELASQIEYTNKQAKPPAKWSWNVDDFRIVVEGVVRFLAKMGYQLEPPAKDRLLGLWKRLHSDETGDTSDW